MGPQTSYLGMPLATLLLFALMGYVMVVFVVLWIRHCVINKYLCFSARDGVHRCVCFPKCENVPLCGVCPDCRCFEDNSVFCCWKAHNVSNSACIPGADKFSCDCHASCCTVQCCCCRVACTDQLYVENEIVTN